MVTIKQIMYVWGEGGEIRFWGRLSL